MPAHITLFHALPGAEFAAIVATLTEECRGVARSGVRIGPPRFLGRGVALDASAPAVAALRTRLAARWREWLSPQDRQGWRPHATVQNKVGAERARALLRRVGREPARARGVRGRAAAVALPWRTVGSRPGRFAFAG